MRTGLFPVSLVCLIALSPFHPARCESQMIPAAVTAALAPDECALVRSEVLVPRRIPAVDVVFVLDTTSSMSQEIDRLALSIERVALRLLDLVEDPAFALVVHGDYPLKYPICDYPFYYGAPGDRPYTLAAAITQDVGAIRSALEGLAAEGGGDEPESYGRALYEVYSDPALGLRPEAHRIVVGFGDSVPHDCDVYACVDGPAVSTGVDPGPDMAAGTADDLAFMDVIEGLRDNCFTMMFVYSGRGERHPLHVPSWQCWAGIIGGQAFQINTDGTVPGDLDLADLIHGYLEQDTEQCDTLGLSAAPGYESWLAEPTPAGFSELPLPGRVSFEYRLCPPPGTPSGTYHFQIFATCDFAQCGDGIIAAGQQITIEVEDTCELQADCGPLSRRSVYGPDRPMRSRDIPSSTGPAL